MYVPPVISDACKRCMEGGGEAVGVTSSATNSPAAETQSRSIAHMSPLECSMDGNNSEVIRAMCKFGNMALLESITMYHVIVNVYIHTYIHTCFCAAKMQFMVATY